MLERYCDILVIGNELPGLISAAFLARRGLSVQVVDSNLFGEHEKYPDPTCFTNLQSKLLRSILGRLNVPELTIQNFLNNDESLQVIFPEHRIDVFSNPVPYFEEIEREFPSHFDKLKAFYENQAKLRHQIDISEFFQKLLPHSWKERREFQKFIEEQKLSDKNSEYQALCKQDARIHAFLKSQYVLAYDQFCEEPFSYQVSELFNPGDGEIFSLRAGLDDLKKMLHDRILHYDGGVKKQVQINSLLFRNGVFEGADIDAQNSQVLCKYLLWNDSLDKLAELLPKKWRFRKLRKQLSDVQSEFHWFSLSFQIDKNYLPDPLKSNAVLITDPNKDLIGSNFLYLQIFKDKLMPKGKVCVHFLLPQSALDENEEFFSPYFSEIENRLRTLFPFCDDKLKLEFPVANPTIEQDTLFPLHENDFEIFKHAAKANGVSVQNQKDFGELFDLHYRTPAPNFFLTNSAVFRGLGTESQFILGLKITDIIWQEVEKVKKRAMKSERRIA
ncbi:MAG: hypothetical protein H7A33_06630 [Deltaproteobacteria bacterium]|nr:hypothetical protein [Deltaproteobacteria bacterium]